MKLICFRPGAEPEYVESSCSVEDLTEGLGGTVRIEPLEHTPLIVISNDEGARLQLPLNRVQWTGGKARAIRGTFYVGRMSRERDVIKTRKSDIELADRLLSPLHILKGDGNNEEA